MTHTNPDPRNQAQRSNMGAPPSETPMGREGGDDALAEGNPTDPRADEKVIVNEQESNRILNRPSQTELGRSSDDVVND